MVDSKTSFFVRESESGCFSEEKLFYFFSYWQGSGARGR